MTVCLHYSVMFLRSKFRSYHLYPACVYIFKWISRNIHSSSVVMHLKVFEYMLTLFTKTLRLFHIRNEILSISSHAKCHTFTHKLQNKKNKYHYQFSICVTNRLLHIWTPFCDANWYSHQEWINNKVGICSENTLHINLQLFYKNWIWPINGVLR